jgi:hypothetical protein
VLKARINLFSLAFPHIKILKISQENMAFLVIQLRILPFPPKGAGWGERWLFIAITLLESSL